MLPFGNRVVAVELTGAALRGALERALSTVGRRGGSLLQVSGLVIVADPSAPEGRRLLEVRVGGTALRDDARVRVAVSSYLASGGDGHVEVAAGRQLGDGSAAPLDADALAAHLRRLSGGGPAGPPPAGRITFRAGR